MKRTDLLCGACAALTGALLLRPRAAGADAPAHWTYSGDSGPSHWGDLEPEFKNCSIGTQQSPVDLTGPVSAQIGAISIAYQSTPLRIINNGHTVQVNYAPGSRLTVRGRTYEIQQFHFHAPSEHTVSGNNLALELHIVHQDDAKNLCVLGVLFAQGAANPALDVVWNALPAQAGPEQTIPGASVNVASLVPTSPAYYEYLGSLTTPPCSESVKWIVLAQTGTVSAAQVAKFQSAFGHNNRPVQPLNQRLLLESGV